MRRGYRHGLEPLGYLDQDSDKELATAGGIAYLDREVDWALRSEGGTVGSSAKSSGLKPFGRGADTRRPSGRPEGCAAFGAGAPR